MAHSCLRNLNLSLAASCKMEIIDKILKRYKHLQIFFNISPKIEKLLKLLANKNCFSDNKGGILLSTRFFITNPLISYSRLKFAKPQAKAKQHLQVGLVLLESYGLSSFTFSFKNNRRYSKKCVKNRCLCFNEFI